MGNNNSGFTDSELTEYEELTFLTKKEIIHAWKKWKELVKVDQENFTEKQQNFPAELVQQLPELQQNPFMDQMVKIFGRPSRAGVLPSLDTANLRSISEEESQEAPPTQLQGYEMNFENFLDLLHVMSPRAPVQLKAHYAFRFFDFDGDTLLNKEDLAEVVSRLTGDQLQEETKVNLVKKLLEETDMEGDGSISEEEFKHLLTRCPDFSLSFRLTL